MPVRNAAETEKAKKSFEIQLDKSQIKELKEYIKALKALKKEVSAPIAISENVVVDIWLDDAYFDSIPTLRPEEIEIYLWMSINNIRKASKNSTPSAIENLIISIWDRASLYDISELFEVEPLNSEIERRQNLMKNMCQNFNSFFVNAAGLSKKEGEGFLDALLNLTFTESEGLIDGILKGNRMIVE